MNFLEKFNVVYKCRLCGKKFTTREIEGYAEAQMYLYRMCVQSKGNNQPYEHHICENGDIGFGDLLGCRKVSGE